MYILIKQLVRTLFFGEMAGDKLAVYMRVLMRLKLCGAKPPLIHTLLWHGA
jgi:hypothetical protein